MYDDFFPHDYSIDFFILTKYSKPQKDDEQLRNFYLWWDYYV